LTLLVGRQAGHPAGKKTEWWGAGVVICLERDADLHMAQLMPLLLTVSCFSKIQIGFTFLVLAHPGSPGQRAVKRMCVSFTSNFPPMFSALRFYKTTTTLSHTLFVFHRSTIELPKMLCLLVQTKTGLKNKTLPTTPTLDKTPRIETSAIKTETAWKHIPLVHYIEMSQFSAPVDK